LPRAKIEFPKITSADKDKTSSSTENLGQSLLTVSSTDVEHPFAEASEASSMIESSSKAELSSSLSSSSSTFSSVDSLHDALLDTDVATGGRHRKEGQIPGISEKTGRMACCAICPAQLTAPRSYSDISEMQDGGVSFIDMAFRLGKRRRRGRAKLGQDLNHFLETSSKVQGGTANEINSAAGIKRSFAQMQVGTGAAKAGGGQGKDSGGCCWACKGDLLGLVQPWDRRVSKEGKRPKCWPASQCVNPKAGGGNGKTPLDNINSKPHIPRNAGNSRDYKISAIR
jgi:hypothetical protein